MRKFIVATLIILLITLSACDPTKNSERIFLMGEGQDTVEINTEWADAGAWLEYGDMIVEANTNDTVDTTVLGLYEVEYTLIHDNISYSGIRYVIVVDQTKPVITLNSGIDTIKLGEYWTDAGATVTDNSGETLIITLEGSIDSGTLGEYQITYSVVDSSGNVQVKTRYVNIIE